MIKLSTIDLDKEYIICKQTANSTLKERLISLGFVLNSSVFKIKKGKSMSIYLIKGMMVALRDEEADFIWVN